MSKRSLTTAASDITHLRVSGQSYEIQTALYRALTSSGYELADSCGAKLTAPIKPSRRQRTTNEVCSDPAAPQDTSIVHRPRVACAGIDQVQRRTVNTGRRVWLAAMIDGLDPKWT
jgi:hypothetical protein